MKIVMGAFACKPGHGSEAGAGWAWAAAAERNHDVWLITLGANRAVLDSEIRERHPRITPVYIDLPKLAYSSAPGAMRVGYARFQQQLKKAALSLNGSVGFDLAHHMTFGADWAPTGLAALKAPLVWGPVGGFVPRNQASLRMVGPRGVVPELARDLITGLGRRKWGREVARRSAIVLAQNSGVASYFAGDNSDVLIEPHIALDGLFFDGLLATAGPRENREAGMRAVFSGRLLRWKGLHLAIDALADQLASEWSLEIIGGGRERSPLEAQARALGLGDRVKFTGPKPREYVLGQVLNADAFLFPSLHDSASWSVAEARRLGCPVVCLDRGGPPEVMGEGGGIAVPVTANVRRDIALALARVPGIGRPLPSRRLDSDRLPELVDRIYKSAVEKNALALSRVK